MMSDAFDPYYIWLGIPPEDQPPNHYRLLGITLFENNQEVIEAAANRQMAYMQEVSGGAEHIKGPRAILKSPRLDFILQFGCGGGNQQGRIYRDPQHLLGRKILP